MLWRGGAPGTMKMSPPPDEIARFHLPPSPTMIVPECVEAIHAQPGSRTTKTGTTHDRTADDASASHTPGRNSDLRGGKAAGVLRDLGHGDLAASFHFEPV